ncbi:hypothetical protein B0J17DRAFT_721768 [Rhizoctonia solani]|nr:hypothetical protein B0J17DRAFT_721768 [Rhizoctonia solani]
MLMELGISPIITSGMIVQLLASANLINCVLFGSAQSMSKKTVFALQGGKTKPVNPLAWWYAQCMAGEEHNGLTQMAIDVLTVPVTSINVEHAFSFVSHLVSKHWHKMARTTVQTTATLGACSHADLIPASILAKAHHKAREHAQASAHTKAAKAKWRCPNVLLGLRSRLAPTAYIPVSTFVVCGGYNRRAAKAEAKALAAKHLEPKGLDDGDSDDNNVLQPLSDIEDMEIDT